jgi:hypothetical protein
MMPGTPGVHFEDKSGHGARGEGLAGAGRQVDQRARPAGAEGGCNAAHRFDLAGTQAGRIKRGQDREVADAFAANVKPIIMQIEASGGEGVSQRR